MSRNKIFDIDTKFETFQPLQERKSHVVTKWAFGDMQTAKLQASLHIRAVLSEALMFVLSVITIYYLIKQIAKLPLRLHGCAGSHETLLFANVRKPILSRCCSYCVRTMKEYNEIKLLLWNVLVC